MNDIDLNDILSEDLEVRAGARSGGGGKSPSSEGSGEKGRRQRPADADLDVDISDILHQEDAGDFAHLLPDERNPAPSDQDDGDVSEGVGDAVSGEGASKMAESENDVREDDKAENGNPEKEGRSGDQTEESKPPVALPVCTGSVRSVGLLARLDISHVLILIGLLGGIAAAATGYYVTYGTKLDKQNRTWQTWDHRIVKGKVSDIVNEEKSNKARSVHSGGEGKSETGS